MKSSREIVFQDNLSLLSVAIITYNSANFINAAIESVIRQDYPNIEIIISDDSSTDNTLEIIKKYTKKYPDKIKVLTAKTNLGAAGNWFKCLSHCTGKYISVLGGDDELLPGALSKQVAVMEFDSNIAICYGDAIVFHVATQKILYNLSDKTPTKSGEVKEALGNCIYYSPTMMFRQELLPKINIFNKIRHGSDIAFYKEIMIRSAPNGKIYYLPEIIYKYQKHDQNITVIGDDYRRDHIKCIKILQNKYPHYKKYLEPAIYDFCCVAFFKSLVKFKLNDASYFFCNGFVSSRGNIFKFFRPLSWVGYFLIKLLWKKLKRVSLT